MVAAAEAARLIVAIGPNRDRAAAAVGHRHVVPPAITGLANDALVGAIAVLGIVMLALTFATVALVQAALGRDVLGAGE